MVTVADGVGVTDGIDVGSGTKVFVAVGHTGSGSAPSGTGVFVGVTQGSAGVFVAVGVHVGEYSQGISGVDVGGDVVKAFTTTGKN